MAGFYDQGWSILGKICAAGRKKMYYSFENWLILLFKILRTFIQTLGQSNEELTFDEGSLFDWWREPTPIIDPDIYFHSISQKKYNSWVLFYLGKSLGCSDEPSVPFLRLQIMSWHVMGYWSKKTILLIPLLVLKAFNHPLAGTINMKMWKCESNT